MKHIEFEKLLEIMERGDLTDPPIGDHLRVCPDCAVKTEKLRNFLNYSKTEKFEEVGQQVTSNLLNIFSRKKLSVKKQSFAEKVLAKLVFDDWQFALNERRGMSDTRQLLFKAGAYEIDLRLQFTGDKCQISGQIFPDCENGLIEIIGSDFRAETESDENCEFFFPQVKKGIYQLICRLDGNAIEIENFSLLT